LSYGRWSPHHLLPPREPPTESLAEDRPGRAPRGKPTGIPAVGGNRNRLAAPAPRSPNTGRPPPGNPPSTQRSAARSPHSHIL